MKTLALLVPALLAASPALALSCAPPDPVRAYREAVASPDSWAVLRGRLDFDAGRMPEGGMTTGEVAPAPVPARFDGAHLEGGRFVPSALGGLDLQPVCAGPWCGSVEPGEYLAFARLTPEGYVIEVGPCGGALFPPEAARELDALRPPLTAP